MKKFMKKGLKRCLIFITALMLLFSQMVTGQNTDMEKQVEKLKLRLQLSGQQTATAREILQEAEDRKVTDRQTYKGDALALIQAAWARQDNVHLKIEAILDSQQLEGYQGFKKLHPVDRELFVLTEGLCLTDEQIFDVEGILIRLHNEYGEPSGLREMMGEGGGKPGGPGGDRGGMGRMPGGRGGAGPASMMKEREAKKAKAIKKVLTQEQKELYEQIRKDRRQKMKEMKQPMKRE